MERILRVSYLEHEPMKPADADFGVTVDFTRGGSDPVRIFQSITTLLDGFRKLDNVLIGALDPKIEPIMVLEDVEANTITAWIRNRLRQVDDQALKEFNWQHQVGKIAVAAKYRAIEYLDKKVDADERSRLLQLREDLEKLTQQVSLRHMPMRAAIPLEDLTTSLDQIQEAKGLLGKLDKLIIKTDEREHTVDLSATKRPSDYLLAPTVARSMAGEMDMVLLVRKPDYLGDTMWEFRHGKLTLNAHIRDEDWLGRFRAGQEIIVPGSALECRVAYDYGYDTQGELQSAKHDVLKVRGITPTQVMVQERLPNT